MENKQVEGCGGEMGFETIRCGHWYAIGSGDIVIYLCNKCKKKYKIK